MTNDIRISVRPLVEYVFRQGSIESGFRTSTALIEGTRAHQKIQKTYSEEDGREVFVKTEIAYGDIVYLIEGRCDGLLFSEAGVTVDEIKSTSGDIDAIDEHSYPVHWAQAKFYAYMYAKANGLTEMGVQLTYVHVHSEVKKRYVQHFSMEELDVFVHDVVKQYAPYAELRLKHMRLRDESIQVIQFPFEKYREGQRSLAGAVYKSIADGKTLFAKAPTGIGKTMSTIFPSVKAIGEGLLQRLFYLTAKTITRTAAEEAFALLQQNGLHLHTVTITAKDKICFKEDEQCDKGACPFAIGYYDRINAAILDILDNETLMTRQVIEQYARKHTVCPFEFSLDAAYAADAMICDYNYVFDPRVSLKRLLEEQKKQSVLLVDEAHNLVDRAREMFSADVSKSSYLALKREFKGRNDAVARAAGEVNEHLLALRKQHEEAKHIIMKDTPDALIALLEAFVMHSEKELAAGGEGEAQQMLLDAYFAAQSFIRISKLYDERYVTYAEIDRSEVRLKMFCLDPSHLLRQAGKGYRAKIYFSATLSPLQFYEDMLGAGEEDYTVSIPSPFKQEQLDVYVQPLSTRYRDRERTRQPIADMLHTVIRDRPGNYLVFFPSYQYLNDVYVSFMEKDGDVQAIVQGSGMTETAREEFLAAFQAGNGGTFVGFAVMGGIFSEGIDLVGDRLNGVIVIGVGLPQLSLERDIIKDYFSETGKNGYNYSYVFPGMNKVLQAGGRLIRSETDTGTIVLVDDRFLQRQYQSLLPEEWRHYKVVK